MADGLTMGEEEAGGAFRPVDRSARLRGRITQFAKYSEYKAT